MQIKNVESSRILLLQNLAVGNFMEFLHKYVPKIAVLFFFLSSDVYFKLNVLEALIVPLGELIRYSS